MPDFRLIGGYVKNRYLKPLNDKSNEMQKNEVRSPFERDRSETLVLGNKYMKSKVLLTPEDFEAQRRQKLKEAVLRARDGSVENSSDIQAELKDAVERDDAPTEMEAEQSVEDEMIDERRRVRIAVRQLEMADLKATYESMMDKLDRELIKERERGKQIRSLRRAWENTRSNAVSLFGQEADLNAVDKSFQDTLDKVNPRIHNVLDIASLEIDSAIHGDNTSKIIMSDGGIRMMDPDVAEYIASVSNDVKFVGSLPEMVSDDRKNMHDYVIGQFEDTPFVDEYKVMREKTDQKRDELTGLIAENQRQASEFESQVYMNTSPERSAQASRRARELPTVAYEYGYLFRGTIEHNGRDLPSSMTSPTMQRELREQGKELEPELE